MHKHHHCHHHHMCGCGYCYDCGRHIYYARPYVTPYSPWYQPQPYWSTVGVNTQTYTSNMVVAPGDAGRVCEPGAVAKSTCTH